MSLFGRDRTNTVLVPYERDTRNHTIVNKIEQRAPTDESIRLLREMEYAAEQRLISSVRVTDTTFECVVHEYTSPSDGYSHTWRAIFSLNGKTHTAAYTAPPPYDAKIWVPGLRDAIAKEIASQILLATLKPPR